MALKDVLKVLFVGDIVGKPGKRVAAALIRNVKEERNIDMVIANGENASGGFGITASSAKKIFSYRVDCITTGNHIWDRKDFIQDIKKFEYVLRPLNYPPDTPGRGWCVIEQGGVKVAVANLMGRIFMHPIDCPFRSAESFIRMVSKETRIIIIDFHAEATAEKVAFGWYVDGKVSAVLGTHTHIQTADEKILPGGTGYITDVGMTGSFDSVIGDKKENAIKRMLTFVPYNLSPGEKDLRMDAVYLEIDKDTGKTVKIERMEVKEITGRQ